MPSRLLENPPVVSNLFSRGEVLPKRPSLSVCSTSLCKIATIAILLPSPVPCCAAETAGEPVILSLRIEGTQRPLSLETQTGAILDRERVARDVRRVWATGWFDDIRVEVCDSVTPSRAASGREKSCERIDVERNQRAPSPWPSPPKRGRGEEKIGVNSLASVGGEDGRRPGEREEWATAQNLSP